MKYLSAGDYVALFAYASLLVVIAIYLRQSASKTIADYFIGGNRVPWWAMGISGMSSCLDMAGTMVIVSFLYLLGPRGIYIEFRGGAVLVLSFMLLWSGKWHYRSKCMTGAEWMEFRFGKSWGGQFARITSAIVMIVSTIGMLAYLIKALGLFASFFVPFSPETCALSLIIVASLYTVISGFYGVVITDLIESLIVISAIVLVSTLAIEKISSIDIAALAYKVTGNSEWTSSSLKWRINMPSGYTQYDDLTILVFFYLLRNIFIGISSAGADPRYFGARSERECGMLSLLWASLMVFRWPMMIGFAALGIFLTSTFFSDHGSLLQAVQIIKVHVHDASPDHWHALVSSIIANPGSYPKEMIDGIRSVLQNDWQSKLSLLSYEGTIDPEKIVPAVILFIVPAGVRGLLVIAFIAAAFSSFSSSVNTATAYFTRDIYQRYLRKAAPTRELILISYSFICIMVAISYIFAYNFHSITHVWGWIIMGLGGGIAVPAMLKFYWWRYNGGGFAIGTLTGLIASFLEIKFLPGLLEWQQFAMVSSISLAATIVGTYLTAPVEDSVLENFYRKTRPFGLWKSFKKMLDPDVRESMLKEHRNDLVSVPFALGWQITLYMFPMQLVLRNYKEFFYTFSLFLLSLAGMYFLWYRNLPPKEGGHLNYESH